MHLGTRKGPRRERDRRCGRDEARPSNVARSVVVRRTGASASCPSSYPRVRRSSCTTFRCFRSSRASRGTTIFLSSTPKTWCKLPKQGACFRLAFVHRTEISLSLFRNIVKHTVSTVHSLFRTEGVRESSSFFFLSTCERNNK